MSDKILTLKSLEGTYCVLRLSKDEPFPPWINHEAFFSITKTFDELSIVCLEQNIPEDIPREGGFEILKVEGPLDFSLTGVIAGISGVLAQNGISLFTVSTFDTDYILIRAEAMASAKLALTQANYEIR